MQDMRLCTCCSLVRPLSEFTKNSSRASGYRSSCRDCTAQRQREHYARNAERVKARVSAYRDLNRAQCSEMTKAWKAKNPEKVRAQRAKENQKRRERSAERARSPIKPMRCCKDCATVKSADCFPGNHGSCQSCVYLRRRAKSQAKYMVNREQELEAAKQQNRREVDELRDRYIVHLLRKGCRGLSPQHMPQSLIEAKRLQIQITRLAKEKKDEVS